MKKSVNKYIGISFFLIFLFTQCRVSEPRPSKESLPTRFGQILFRYEKETSTYKIEASFETGSEGERRSLEMKSVALNGQELTSRPINNRLLRYEQTGKKTLDQENRVFIRDQEDHPIEFTIPVNALDSFFFKAPPSRTKGALITWEGEPLALGEIMIALLTDGTNQTISQEIYGPKPLNYLPILPVQLENLQTDDIDVFLIRKNTYDKTFENLEILITTEFDSGTRSFTLLE